MRNRREFLEWAAVAAAPAVLGSAATSAQEKPKSTPLAKSDSHIGNLFPFVKSQTVTGEFPLSFLRDEFQVAATWRKQARGKLLELLHYAPAPCDPKPETVESVDCGDYVREKVWFNTTPDLRVPAFAMVPKKRERKLPGVVALHDHGGFYLWGKEKIVETADEHPTLTEFKKNYYAGNSIASVLARKGYVVIVIDMFYWGERRMLLDDDAADWRERPQTMGAERVRAFNQRASQNEQLLGRTIYAAGFTWPGVMFWDDIRTVDYLRSRPEVDPDRIGCVGLSVGGLRACHLTALDDRVKAGVVVGWMASFPAQLRSHIRNTIGHTKVVPGLYRYLDYPDVAALAMPRALLVINGSRDGLFDLDGVRHSFKKLESCYDKAGVKEKVRTRLYDSPHEFNADMQTEAWQWLDKWV